MNTHQISQLISNLQFDNALVVLDRFVFINLDYLTNRDYQNQGISELIYTAGSYQNYTFVFLIRDGVNCKLTGLEYAIKVIITNLNLDKNTCYIYSYEDLEIANATWIKLDVIQMWCSLIQKQLPNYNKVKTNLSKTFAALFGRHDLYRLKIFRYLRENYQDQSLLSYHSQRAHWNYRFRNQFDNDQEYHAENCPHVLDFEKNDGWIPYQQSLSTIGNYVSSYFVEIVSETDVYSNKFFTEKSLKNFYLGKPFILMGGQFSLEHLQQYGFKTFTPWIDESYDTIACPHQRLVAIFKEIQKLAQYSLDQLQSLENDMQPIFEHNKEKFLKICLTC